MEKRRELRKRKKIVIKVGSSTITHEKTGQINIEKIEKMARRIADLKGMGKQVDKLLAMEKNQRLCRKSRPFQLLVRQG